MKRVSLILEVFACKFWIVAYSQNTACEVVSDTSTSNLTQIQSKNPNQKGRFFDYPTPSKSPYGNIKSRENEKGD